VVFGVTDLFRPVDRADMVSYHMAIIFVAILISGLRMAMTGIFCAIVLHRNVYTVSKLEEAFYK